MKLESRWLGLFKNLIETPSVSSVRADLDVGNKTVSELLANVLEQAGCVVTLQDVPGHAAKNNVVAKLGQGDGGLVLSGHTDTVPYDESKWETDPFDPTIQDDKIFGLGSCDMKGFFVCVVEALTNIDPRKLKKPLIIVGTADEESGMAGAKELLKGRPLNADYAVIGEPTSNQPITMHKGIFMEGIRYTGRSGHSSDPDNGRSALDGMHELLSALMHYREKLKNKTHPGFAIPYPTINFGSIKGGDNPNRICAQCELQLDARVVPGVSLEEVRNEIQRIAKKVAYTRHLEVEFLSLFDGIEAMETDHTSPIVRCCETISGRPASSVDFATEGPYFSAMGVQTVVMGPGSIAVAHQPNEFVSMNEMQHCRQNLEQLIHQVCIDN